MNGNKWSNKFPDQEVVKDQAEKRPHEEGPEVAEPTERR
jgi:hypothetical protein